MLLGKRFQTPSPQVCGAQGSPRHRVPQRAGALAGKALLWLTVHWSCNGFHFKTFLLKKKTVLKIDLFLLKVQIYREKER